MLNGTLLEISEKRMRSITRLYVEGATISQPRLYLQRRTSSKLSTTVAWMECHFNRIGDKMPHLQQIHLPNFMSKKVVYRICPTKDCANRKSSPAHTSMLFGNTSFIIVSFQRYIQCTLVQSSVILCIFIMPHFMPPH